MNQFVAALLAFVLQHPGMPPGMCHDEHMKQMAKDAALKQRGALAMGFAQDKTTHHFSTSVTGGSIEVEVKDAADSASRRQIRRHLKDIAGAFAKGDFAKPFQTHAEVPPGVPAMQRLKSVIRARSRFRRRTSSAWASRSLIPLSGSEKNPLPRRR